MSRQRQLQPIELGSGVKRRDAVDCMGAAQLDDEIEQRILGPAVGQRRRCSGAL